MTKKIGLIVGSLRKESWNRKVAEKVKAMFPEGYEAEFIEIGDLPLYNEDYEKEKNEPESYGRFRKEVEEKDGYIFFTPRPLKTPSTWPAAPTARANGAQSPPPW